LSAAVIDPRKRVKRVLNETPTKKRWYKRWWGIGLIAFGALILLGGIFGEPQPEAVAEAAPVEETTTTPPPTTTTEAPTTTLPPTTTTEAPTTTLPPTTTTAPLATTTTVVVPAAEGWTMPDLVGQNLQDAQDTIQSQTDRAILLTLSHDVSGKDRAQMLDSGWIVCDQNIVPGAPIDATTTIDFGVVRVFESCPA
jgi:hypothetical protein